jgi:hypothetical protein
VTTLLGIPAEEQANRHHQLPSHTQYFGNSKVRVAIRSLRYLHVQRQTYEAMARESRDQAIERRQAAPQKPCHNDIKRITVRWHPRWTRDEKPQVMRTAPSRLRLC